MNRSIFSLALFCVALTGAAFTYGQINLRADKSKSFLSYYMVHPMHDWEGVNNNPECIVVYDEATNAIQKVAVAAKVAEFDTKNSNRDGHAMEVLEGLKYPKVTFSSTGITKTGKSAMKIDGNLTFHGVQKWVSFVGTREDVGSEIVVSGKFPVSLTDFKIERPSLMTVPVKDNIDISFKMTFPKTTKK